MSSGVNALNLSIIESIVRDIVNLQRKKIEIIIVSSGAIAVGLQKLEFSRKPKTIPQKQAVAAVGQIDLMLTYEQLFSKHQQKVAQILLTHDDLRNRKRYINARNTIFTLLNFKVVPIINENDSVVVEEIKFGDNDNLSALITSLVEADLLIILSDVNGLYTIDPNKDKKAKIISLVEKITPKIEEIAGGSISLTGTGGMYTKLQAAKKVSDYGVPMVIANGKKEGILKRIFEGEEVGTLFLPKRDKLTSRKHWIAHILTPRGKLIVDQGAKQAIIGGGKSLLPAGILKVEGSFGLGDAVSCLDGDGLEFARGLVGYQVEEVKKIKGLQSKKIKEILGYQYYDEVIHRDDLVILGEEC